MSFVYDFHATRRKKNEKNPKTRDSHCIKNTFPRRYYPNFGKRKGGGLKPKGKGWKACKCARNERGNIEVFEGQARVRR